MAWSTFRMRWLIACILFSVSVRSAQNDTLNGTSIYKLAIGTGISGSTTSHVEPSASQVDVADSLSSERTVSQTSSPIASSGPYASARSSSRNSTSTSSITHDIWRGLAQTGTGLLSFNATNATASEESTSYIADVVYLTRMTSISYSNSSNATSTSSPNATITTPPWSNLTTTLPAGIGTLGNATFHSSCAYSDTACYSTCSVNFDSCSYSWGQYSVLYQSWLASASSEGLVSVSVTSSTTISYIYTLTSYLETTISTATSIFHTPTTYTAITSEARSECQYITQTFTSPYTLTMATNNCSDDEMYSTFTTTVVLTATGLYGENNGVFTYATATVGVYTTSTRTVVSNYYTTMAPSFSIAAPKCQSAGCVQEAQYGCGDEAWSCTVGPNCNLCTIYGGTVQLLYWPVSTSSPTANGTVANTTSSPTITEMSTAIYEGYTLVSPSVYISFETAYAMNDCNSTIGQAHTGSIIGLDPADLSSAVGNQHYLSYSPASGSVSAAYSMAAAPFNLNNLNWPYNPFAYLNQPSCNTRGGLNYDFDCAFILEDSYNPVLVVPDEVRSMDPAWASCAVDWEGLYDPPSALQPATAAATVTLPRQESSTDPASTTPASAAATPTTVAAETSPAISDRVTIPNTPAATADGPTSTPEADQTEANESNPSSADPGQADPSPAAPADPTTTGVGDFIASVIGLVPSAASADSANDGTGAAAGGNAQTTVVDNQRAPSDGNSDTGNDSLQTNVPAPAQTPPGADASATQVNGATQNSDGSGSPVATFVADGSTQAVTQIASDAAIINGKTLSIGGVATVFAGQTISLGSAGLVAANSEAASTIQFSDPSVQAVSPAASSVATFVAGGTTYTAVQTAGADNAVLGGATLSQGGPAATLGNGETVSLGLAGLVVINGEETSTAAFQTAQVTSQAAQEAAVFVIDGTTYTAQAEGGAQTAVIDGQTLSVNGPAVTIDDSTISLGSDGLVVANGAGQTSTVSFGAATTEAATFVVHGKTYTALQSSGAGTAVIDGQSLSIGGPAITIDGETISLGPNGLVIAADGTTSTAQSDDLPPSVIPTNWISEAVITAGSSILTAYGIAGESGKLVLDGTTLTEGGSAVTIDGEVFSLGEDGLVESEGGAKTTLSGVGVSAPTTSASKSSNSASSRESSLVTSPASRASTSAVRETGSSTTSAADGARPRTLGMTFALLFIVAMIFM